MFYYLSYLRDYYFGFNVFSYLTLRSGLAAVTAFLMCFLFGSKTIQFLKALGLVHRPKVYGLQSHEYKAGLPVAGGILIAGSIFVSVLLWAKPFNRFILLAQGALIVFGALGFWDDWTKIKGARPAEGASEGISSKSKFFIQVAFAGLLALYLAMYPPNPAYPLTITIPYIKETYVHLGVLYFVLLMLLFVGFTNSVNIADGMDGLAIGNIVIFASTLLVFVYLAGHAKFSQYLKIIPVRDAGELSVVLSAVVGAGLGFLWFNSYPAQIFMGDTGSLPLGALLVYVSIVAKQELLMLIVGGVFVAEALSVIAQIVYFKITGGKRIFKMSPFHHHFELSGVAEPKVVTRFWIAGIILSIVAFASLKVR